MRIGLLLATVAATAVTIACAAAPNDNQGVESPTEAAGWHRVADPPLAPRLGAVTAWIRGEAYVVGGDTSRPCPPNADCRMPDSYAKDGAAFDPGTGVWRRIADAPQGIPSHASSAVTGDQLFVLTGRTLQGYDASTDRWSTVRTPADQRGALLADGDRLVLPSGSDESGEVADHVYHVPTGTWSTLPPDPIGPAFDRYLTSTKHGLVLTAKHLVDNPGADGPALVLAARLDDSGTWKRLPDSDQLGGWSWSWTGRRMVDPTLGGADGGSTGNYGRTVPYGGLLDPDTGVWSALPDPPREGSGGWPVEASAGPRVAAAGWVYNDRDESWTRVSRPSGGPDQPGSAVWAGQSLLVIGGTGWSQAPRGQLSPHAWLSDYGSEPASG